MKSDRRGPSSGRFEYHWRVDREYGFEISKLIYDSNGRLAAIDYEVARKPPRAEVAEPRRA